MTVIAGTAGAPWDWSSVITNLIGSYGTLRINPLYLEGYARRPEVADLGVTPEEYGHFLGRAFQIWFSRRDSVPPVEPLHGYYEYYLGRSDTQCCDEAGSCGRSHLGIDPDGGTDPDGPNVWRAPPAGIERAQMLEEIVAKYDAGIRYLSSSGVKIEASPRTSSATRSAAPSAAPASASALPAPSSSTRPPGK
jgi:hypothetical protein